MSVETISSRETEAVPTKPDPKAPYKPGDPVTVKLSRPLRTASHDRTELVLNMPTMRSFRLHGEMIRTINLTPKDNRVKETAKETRQEVSFDYDAVIGYLSDATGISTIELDGLAGNDVEILANALLMMTRVRGPLA